MSKATKLWDEWCKAFIAKHKPLGELEPTLSYSDQRWGASIQIRQCEPCEVTWLEDIGVSGWGSSPLAAVEACIVAGEAYEMAEAGSVLIWMADRQVIKLPDGTLTIVDSSSAQKPGVDAPCPTRKQGCDNPQLDGQPETCHGSHNEGTTPIEEAMSPLDYELARELVSKGLATSVGQILDSANSPNWEGCRGYDWECCVPFHIKNSWGKLSASMRLVALSMALCAANEIS